ncbi:radical SAM-associated putative lipoprotein [Parabacteroides sp. PF5-9]|uniref:radical SAM-associated putative lipoprotein n=1 Tax=Parabacteroides sp. PF5-9 TaxID=1742404 RepID=UPI002476C902|nr:radical SAM-associated putative lipoprotein [Parabacteroides sp. PF5-9]MDH6359175.1 putative lipoprotein (rSAM/lipoprotein system) [Parabacteroides sp. PF5-9]
MMKRSFQTFLKGCNFVLAGLLALLGFASCDAGENAAMYGVPWKGYGVQGKVVDKTTKKALPGMEVKAVVPDSLSAYYPVAWRDKWLTTTDQNGNYLIEDTPDLEGYKLVVSDKDGETNGWYDTDTLIVDDSYKTEHLGGGGGWFQGYLTKMVDIALEEKEKDE